MQLCFIDTETTGLYTAAGDRICEIGLIVANSKLEMVEQYDSLINPQRPISPEAYRVNRISQADLEGAPLFADLVSRLSSFVSDRIIVGHNIEFDYEFLKNEFSLSGADFNPHALLDTRMIAKSLIHSPSYGLSTLMRRFGIRIPNRHRAMGDCLATFELFVKLFRLYEEKNGGNLTNFIKEHSIQACKDECILPSWLEKALESGLEVKIEYRDRANQRSVRIIKPQRVFSAHGRNYLEAFCMSRMAKRTFLLDRIKIVDY